jgi:hypothetical protein
MPRVYGYSRLPESLLKSLADVFLTVEGTGSRSRSWRTGADPRDRRSGDRAVLVGRGHLGHRRLRARRARAPLDGRARRVRGQLDARAVGARPGVRSRSSRRTGGHVEDVALDLQKAPLAASVNRGHRLPCGGVYHSHVSSPQHLGEQWFFRLQISAGVRRWPSLVRAVTHASGAEPMRPFIEAPDLPRGTELRGAAR